MSRARVLVVDDKPNMVKLCRDILKDSYNVESAPDGKAALAKLTAAAFEVVLTDLKMPGLDGRRLLDNVKRCSPDTEVILMTGFATIESAVDAMRAGAFDYLSKPFDPDALFATVKRAVERTQKRNRARKLHREIEARAGLDAVVGRSTATKPVFEAIERARESDLPCLVVGDEGTGKSLVASVIHHGSRRRAGPFASWDSRAVDARLAMEGFARAVTAAEDGSLLLEEIAVMPRVVQVHLLQRLQTGPAIEARLIATTRFDLELAVSSGTFSRELLYALNVITIRVPPLRERREDIALLAAHFIAKHAPRIGTAAQTVDARAIELLSGHDWPRNVAELENAIIRALAACTGDTLLVEHLPAEVQAAPSATATLRVDPTSMSYRDAVSLARDRMSKEYITALLEACDGNVTHAADRAGLERESLHRLMRRYGIKGLKK